MKDWYVYMCAWLCFVCELLLYGLTIWLLVGYQQWMAFLRSFHVPAS